MAMWQKIQQLPNESINLIYKNDGFPFIFRHVFAEWIEDQDWFALDENDEKYGIFAKTVLDTLIQKMQEKIAHTTDFYIKTQLQKSFKQFAIMYGGDPQTLIRAIKNCLTQERRLLLEEEQGCLTNGSGDPPLNISQLILQEIAFTVKLSQETERDVKLLQQEQESFIIQHQYSMQIDTDLETFAQKLRTQDVILAIQQMREEKIKLEKLLEIMSENILKMRITMVQKFEQTLPHIAKLLANILDEELCQWKHKQRLACNGAHFDNNLMSIQNWCESVAEIIWQNRHQIKQLDRLLSQFPISNDHVQSTRVRELESVISSHLSYLIQHTFIIENQPPQVLKKEARFSASIRLLVGSKLNVHMNSPQVSVALINELQSHNVMTQGTVSQLDLVGEILNNTGLMEYDHTNSQLGVTFRNMQLKKFKRPEKKSTEAVTEEKFSLLFYSEFNLGNGELVFQVRTLSLPVAVIVHGNQDCNAQATIMWDNAFAVENRTHFEVPDCVPWPMLGEHLSMKFRQFTDRGLGEDNLLYLRSKTFGNTVDVDKNKMVNWSQFNKDPLLERNFTFWEWFYGILRLTKEHLRGLWKEGSIIGFVSKEKSQESLMSCPNGTFLLRFSDSEIGGITIAWVGDCMNVAGKRMVYNVAPYKAKDFAVRCLADRISDLEQLTFLYPDIPKNNAFSHYYTSASVQQKGQNGSYIMAELVDRIHIPAAQSPPMNYENQVSSQTHMFPTPAAIYDNRAPSLHNMYGMTQTNSDMYSSPNQLQMEVADSQSDGLETLMAIKDHIPGDVSFFNVSEILSDYKIVTDNCDPYP